MADSSHHHEEGNGLSTNSRLFRLENELIGAPGMEGLRVIVERIDDRLHSVNQRSERIEKLLAEGRVRKWLGTIAWVVSAAAWVVIAWKLFHQGGG